VTKDQTGGKLRTDAAATRRVALLASGAVLISLSPLAALAQQKKGPPPAAGQVPAADLMKPGPLPDLALGKADAPVTIIEFASLTCGHCANFHNTVFPKLKEKYIDTGKVRFILREFPLDNRAAAAAMVARCAGEDKSYALISDMFTKQESWAFVQPAAFIPALFEVSKAHGFTKDSFDKCVADQKLLDNVAAARDLANKSFGVRSTPTFFINGRRLDGNPGAIESFDKAIEAATAPAAPAAPAEKK
jgi:protein-disulfide isomerase